MADVLTVREETAVREDSSTKLLDEVAAARSGGESYVPPPAERSTTSGGDPALGLPAISIVGGDNPSKGVGDDFVRPADNFDPGGGDRLNNDHLTALIDHGHGIEIDPNGDFRGIVTWDADGKRYEHPLDKLPAGAGTVDKDKDGNTLWRHPNGTTEAIIDKCGKVTAIYRIENGERRLYYTPGPGRLRTSLCTV